MAKSKTVLERNSKIKKLLTTFYKKAMDDSIVIDSSEYIDSLTPLFNTSVWGYREILLVVIVAMKIDQNFKASVNFYKCNPRAIFEGPIKEFLIENNLPHRKSGPLNIAKATQKLDNSWASNRQEPQIAENVLELLQYLEDQNRTDDDLNNFAIFLLRLLHAEESLLLAFETTILPEANPDFLLNTSQRLINEAPDGGNTPQKISGLLLKNLHKSLNTSIVVTGYNDRASVTSTTSKKPGDVNEESKDGDIYKVYEVTVKKFDLARIRDSFDAVTIYNKNHQTSINEIIVICRPNDCIDDMADSGYSLYLGKYQYKNITYYFWNIYEWIAATLQHMTVDGRTQYYNELNSYINEINTAKKVKTLWKQIHEELSHDCKVK